MAILRPCGRFARIFMKASVSCQVRCKKQSFFNPKHIGYVHHIHNTTYDKKINFKKQQLLMENTTSINNNVDDDRRNNNIPIQLQDYLEILSTGFNDMRVDYNILLHALKIYAKSPDIMDDSINIFLLNCCGNVLPDVKHELRQNLTHHLWRLLKKNNPQMSLEYYYTYLDVCAQNCEKIQPKEFINSMNVEPDNNIYTYLLNVAAKIGDSDSANFILSKMKELNYSLNNEMFNALIEVYFRKGDLEQVNLIMKTLAASKVQIHDEIYASLAYGYAMQGDINNVLKLLETHSINDKYLLLIIKSLSLSNRGDDINKIFKYFSQEKVLTDPLLHNTIIELVHLQKLDDALLIVDFFQNNHNSNATIHLVNHFLKAIIRVKLPKELILNLIREFSKIHLSSKIMLSSLEESLRSSYKDLSLQLIAEMQNLNIDIRTHYFWPLLLQASKQHGETGVIDIIKHMIQLQIPFDHETLLHYIIPNINVLQPMDTLRKLTNYGISQLNVFTSLMSYHLEKGELKKTLILCNKMSNGNINFDKILPSVVKAYEITRDIETCTKVLKFASKNKNYHTQFLLQIVDNKLFKDDIMTLFKEFLHIFTKYDMQISGQDAKLIMEKLSLRHNDADEIIDLITSSPFVIDRDINQRDFVPSSAIPHPRDMTTEQLECHLIELKSKGLNYRGVLRKLFMIHGKNNNFKRVENIKEEMERNNMGITSGMKVILFELYARNGQIGELCEILIDIKNNDPNFKIDPPKILCAATALANKNKVDVGQEIIRNNGKSSFKIERQCWKLLDAIARSEHPELVNSTLNLLVENRYCDIGTNVLGPFIRRHLIKNNIPAAVEEFQMIVEQYNKTPLRQELISILVELSNNNSSNKQQIKSMLADVLALVAKIHGDHVVEMDLIMSYARSGMQIELQTALQNLKAILPSIREYTNAMPEDVKLNVLNMILDSSHGIENIHRHSIYDLILSIYCNTGNYQDALNLWNKMNNEKLTPSVEFKNNISLLLASHQVKIPYELRM
ncbi:hypothetical protein PV325_009743 [Microctonus aethiopoides]|nr:hypothetical protein PV325_009743 [Microctonus aethiopoides]KAK0091647.1 hypothetical protein PV326_002919 [Microctonus aethiopoides]